MPLRAIEPLGALAAPHRIDAFPGPRESVPGMFAIDAILPDVREALAEVVGRGNADTHQMQQTMRRVVGRWTAKRLRRSPMIIPTVIEA